VSAGPGIAAARSLLFVPGSRPDRFAKAAASGADAVILDLEDAVAPPDKATARAAAADWLARHPATVRINPPGTPWHADDLAALAEARQLAGVVLPKAESADDVRGLTAALPGTRPVPPVLALVETARGIRDAALIAELPGVSRLAFGSFDFCLDAGITVAADDERELLHARSTLVVASRAAGLPGPVDGVHARLDDPAGLHAATRRSSDLGFTGRLCVHPGQVPVVHEALRPDPARLAWARRVVDAAGGTGGAAVRVDGQMIDAPRLAEARRLLALAGGPGNAPTPPDGAAGGADNRLGSGRGRG
jgi:citrate lyase subunit beta / citryl-CoA lyase